MRCCDNDWHAINARSVRTNEWRTISARHVRTNEWRAINTRHVVVDVMSRRRASAVRREWIKAWEAVEGTQISSSDYLIKGSILLQLESYIQNPVILMAWFTLPSMSTSWTNTTWSLIPLKNQIILYYPISQFYKDDTDHLFS